MAHSLRCTLIYSSYAFTHQSISRVHVTVSCPFAEIGFRIAQVMDIAVFVVGVVLLIASAIMALTREGSLATWASAGVSSGLGVLGVVYSTLVAKPRRKVEESIDHLMHLQATFLGFLRQLHHVEQVKQRPSCV